MGEMAGKSFTGVTVTRKERATVLSEGWSSLTMTMMTAAPNTLATDVKVRMPLAFGPV
jgi:hypothetical protein